MKDSCNNFAEQKFTLSLSHALETKASFSSGSFAGQQIKSRPKYKRIKIHAITQQKANEPKMIAAIIPGLNLLSGPDVGADVGIPISTEEKI